MSTTRTANPRRTTLAGLTAGHRPAACAADPGCVNPATVIDADKGVLVCRPCSQRDAA